MAAHAANAGSAVRPGPDARRVALRVGKRHVRQGLAVGGGQPGGGVGNGVGLVNGVVHAAGGRAHGEGRGIGARFGGRTAHGAPVLGVGNGIGTRESRGVIARAQARRFSVPVIGERAGRRADGDAQALGDIAALAAGGRHGGAVGLIAPGMGVGFGEDEAHGTGRAAPGEGRGVAARRGGRTGYDSTVLGVGDSGVRCQPQTLGNRAGNCSRLGVAVADQVGGGVDGQGDAFGFIVTIASSRAGGRHGGAVGLIAPGMGVGGGGEGELHGSGLGAPPGEGRGVGARRGGRGAAARIIGDAGPRGQTLGGRSGIAGNPGRLGVAVAHQAGGGMDGQGDPIRIISIRAIIKRIASGLDCVFITTITPCMVVGRGVSGRFIKICKTVVAYKAIIPIRPIKILAAARGAVAIRVRRGKHPRQQADGHRQRQQDAEQGSHRVFHRDSSSLFRAARRGCGSV